MMSSLTEGTAVPLYDVNTFGNVNRLMRIFEPRPLQVVRPEGQGGEASSIACVPLNAHWNSVWLLQLLSTVAMDPVESMMMATFHRFPTP